MKKSLLIGINYTGTNNALNGCINDISHINTFLTTKCGYNASNIKILTDNTTEKPLRSNIENGIKWLVKDCKAGDTLFFYYSGHGSQIQDINKDEKSGLDDVMVPLDFMTTGVITDDWLYTNLASKIPQGVTLWAFTDCCHSGTMFDLKYDIQYDCIYKNGQINNKIKFVDSEWSNKFTVVNESTKDTPGDIFMFSGCLDSQTSADAFENGQYQGAFSFCFLEFLQNNPKFNTKKVCDMLKEIDCRLKIHGYQQISMLSLGRLQDLNNLFKP